MRRGRNLQRHPFLQPHSNPLFWAERETWTRSDHMPWLGAELKLLRDRGQKNSRFHHGEGCADALPGAASEREICKLRELLRFLWQPAVGVELLRLGEIPGIVVHDPSAHDHIRSSGYVVTAEFEFLDHGSGHTPCRGIEPHGFLDDSFRVG